MSHYIVSAASPREPNTFRDIDIREGLVEALSWLQDPSVGSYTCAFLFQDPIKAMEIVKQAVSDLGFFTVGNIEINSLTSFDLRRI